MNLYRLASTYYALLITWRKKMKKWDPNIDSPLAKKFISYSNKYYVKKMINRDLKPENILVLMPHCVQSFECPFKVTSYIENCKKCGKCKIQNLQEFHEKYGVHVKIATGGTLARKVIKETKPKFVIAVACERDLVSGIFDIYPMPVYGIFNVRPNGPCVSTDFNMAEVKNVVFQVLEKKNSEGKE
ncbi:MAG: DUF116 domain-containing protein [Fusobacteria bacterium]|nr:DUF116 domain-containing protein [Fusobacteriota bacterium]